jgi:tetratricopeptide (TPR) repeat protein
MRAWMVGLMVVGVVTVGRAEETGEALRAHQLMVAGKVAEGVRVADAAVKANAGDRDALMERAWGLGALGRRAESERDFAALVAGNPQDAQPFVNHGALAFENGDFQAALADFSHGLVRDPNNAYLWKQRGLTFLAIGYEEPAGVDFKHWIVAEPGSAEAHAWRAYVLWRLNDGDGEKGDLEAAKSLAPGDAARWDRIDDGGEFPVGPTKKMGVMEALDCPEHEKAVAFNQEGLGWMGRDQEMAVRGFENAVNADQVWGVPWCNRAMALVKFASEYGGTLDAAYGYLRHGYMLDPRLMREYEAKLVGYEEKLQGMGLMDAKAMMPTAAGRAQIDGIMEVGAARAEGKRLRATNQRGELGNALYAYLRAMRLDPMNSEARVRRARIFREDFQPGRLDMAMLDLSAAVRVDPTNWEAFRLRAAVWEDAGVFDGAYADCSEAIGLKPEFAPLYLERAEATLMSGGNADADLATAQKLDPTNFEAGKAQVLQDVESAREQAEQGREWAESMAKAWKQMRALDRQATLQRANEAEARGDVAGAQQIREHEVH